MIEMDEYQCRLYEPMEMFSFQKFSQGILRPTLNLTRSPNSDGNAVAFC